MVGYHLGADPRGGPWASVIKNDPAFAAEQCDSGASVEQASVAFVPLLQAKLKAAQAKPAAPPALPQGPSGAPPLRSRQ